LTLRAKIVGSALRDRIQFIRIVEYLHEVRRIAIDDMLISNVR